MTKEIEKELKEIERALDKIMEIDTYKEDDDLKVDGCTDADSSIARIRALLKEGDDVATLKEETPLIVHMTHDYLSMTDERNELSFRLCKARMSLAKARDLNFALLLFSISVVVMAVLRVLT
jgi:hypothetical protein